MCRVDSWRWCTIGDIPLTSHCCPVAFLLLFKPLFFKPLFATCGSAWMFCHVLTQTQIHATHLKIGHPLIHVRPIFTPPTPPPPPHPPIFNPPTPHTPPPHPDHHAPQTPPSPPPPPPPPPGQNGRQFTHDIFVNEKFCILIKISLKFVPKAPIDSNPALVNARFTPNRDQLRTDLRVEKFWISWTREQSLNFYRQIAS